MINKIAVKLNQSSAAEIVAHLLRADASFEPSLSSRVDIRAYAQKLADRAVRFEAWLGEEMIGLVASYCNQPDKSTAFVTSVSVLPQCQGQGIGVWLMRQCIEHVRCLGFRQMELEVDERSLPAIRLYKKLGFNTLRRDSSTLAMGMTLERKPI